MNKQSAVIAALGSVRAGVSVQFKTSGKTPYSIYTKSLSAFNQAIVADRMTWIDQWLTQPNKRVSQTRDTGLDARDNYENPCVDQLKTMWLFHSIYPFQFRTFIQCIGQKFRIWGTRMTSISKLFRTRKYLKDQESPWRYKLSNIYQNDFRLQIHNIGSSCLIYRRCSRSHWALY